MLDDIPKHGVACSINNYLILKFMSEYPQYNSEKKEYLFGDFKLQVEEDPKDSAALIGINVGRDEEKIYRLFNGRAYVYRYNDGQLCVTSDHNVTKLNGYKVLAEITHSSATNSQKVITY